MQWYKKVREILKHSFNLHCRRTRYSASRASEQLQSFEPLALLEWLRQWLVVVGFWWVELFIKKLQTQVAAGSGGICNPPRTPVGNAGAIYVALGREAARYLR